MLKSLCIGIGGVILLSIFWVVVQAMWRNIFADHLTDDDVLAGRTSCSNCGCTTVCSNKNKQEN